MYIYREINMLDRAILEEEDDDGDCQWDAPMKQNVGDPDMMPD